MIFISYSHKDRRWLEQFKTQLAPLTRLGLTIWDDTILTPGTNWRESILLAIGSSGAALLLVSPTYLASEFIQSDELQPIYERHRSGSIKILWAHLSACLYEHSVLASLQAAHDVSRPLDTLAKPARGKAISEICRNLHAIASSSSQLDQTEELDFILILSGQIELNRNYEVISLLERINILLGNSNLRLLGIDVGSIRLTLRAVRMTYDRLAQAVLFGEFERVTGHIAHAIFPIQKTQDNLLAALATSEHLKSVAFLLNPRQRYILKLISQGHSILQIAVIIGMSLINVKIDISAILDVLRANTRRQDGELELTLKQLTALRDA